MHIRSSAQGSYMQGVNGDERTLQDTVQLPEVFSTLEHTRMKPTSSSEWFISFTSLSFKSSIECNPEPQTTVTVAYTDRQKR